MDQQTINRAKKLLAILHVALLEIDDLEENGAIFKNSLKYSGKKFKSELESLFSNFYGNMSEEANLQFNAELNRIEQALYNHDDQHQKVA
jgi:hypothetical protein